MTFTLGPEAVSQMREIARRVLRESRAHTTARPARGRDTGLFVGVAKTSTGGIAARTTALVCSSGTATLYYKSTGDTLTAASTSADLTLWNMTTQTVGGSAWVQFKQDIFGTLWVDVENC